MVVEERKKKEKKTEEGAPSYMVTYGDLMSLLLTFFIMLLSAAKIEGQELQLILANFPGLGNYLGGQSFNEGRLPNSGQVQNALPSFQQGNALDRLQNTALQVFKNEIARDQMKVIFDEKGLVISLASDLFFEKYSANFNENTNVESLRKLAGLLREYIIENPTKPYRIEGHTDEKNFPAGLPYQDEWDLSTARAITVLRILEQFLVPTSDAQVTGFGNTKPLYESSGEGSAFNRRVDIIILNEGNL